MSGKRWKIATIRDIPLYVGSSWIWLAAIYIWGQYVGLTRGFARVEPGEALFLAVLTAVLFFGSVLLHEAAHAVMARSLDLPVLGITLVFWGGATETKASGRGPLGEFLVAFVGPATTLALAGVFWLAHTATHGTLADILGYLAFISLLFAGLNAVPGFPLDGGRMFLAVAWGITKDRQKALRAAGYMGIAVGVAFLGGAAWQFVEGNTFFAIFAGYIGFMIFSTGRAMEQRIALRGQLMRGTAADAMRPPPVAIPADLTLTEALDHHLRGTPSADGFPVVDQGRVIGMISMGSARRVGGRDPLRPVRDGMAPLSQTPVVAPEETLDEVLEWLAGREGLVLRDGSLLGAIAPTDIERWYRLVVEGRPMESVGTDGVPPRPDL